VHTGSLTPHAFLIFFIPSLFCIWFSLFEVVHKFLGACGVNYTSCTMHAVLMTPHAPCMRYQWYRMHRACSINDTGCTINFLHNFEKWKSYAKQKQWHRMHFKKFEYLRKFELRNTKRLLPLNQGPRADVLMKNRGPKISWHCPFNRLTMMCSTMLTITQCYFIHLFLSTDILVLLYHVDWYNDMCINCLVDIMRVDISTPWS
jgi:hypothetical protein